MQNRVWIDNLKLAIINDNIDQIVKYSQNVPTFDNLNDAQTAMALIKQAETAIRKEQKKIAQEMQKIKQIKKYLR